MDRFRLDNKVAVITGGGGLLGAEHANAIAEAGGIPVLWDINEPAAVSQAERIDRDYNVRAVGHGVDVIDPVAIQRGLEAVLERYDRIDILINNAACNPKMEIDADLAHAAGGDSQSKIQNPKSKMQHMEGPASRLENFSLETWQRDLSVGLTGAFLCAQVLGTAMAQRSGGVIVNIASDLALIGPDQRIYRQPGLPEEAQPVKPVTYSVVKGGLLGLTRYLATYWAEQNVRVNAICPGGVQNGQPEGFVQRLTQLIPMGRMARRDEYRAAIVFLCSDASSYMTGSNLVIDGGRTAW